MTTEKETLQDQKYFLLSRHNTNTQNDKTNKKSLLQQNQTEKSFFAVYENKWLQMEDRKIDPQEQEREWECKREKESMSDHIE